jgi:hypothetical protein
VLTGATQGQVPVTVQSTGGGGGQVPSSTQVFGQVPSSTQVFGQVPSCSQESPIIGPQYVHADSSVKVPGI